MKKTLAVLATVAAVGVTAVAAPAPAEARGRGIGPGLAFGLAAGAITAGAIAASHPYGYYGPSYGYYDARPTTVLARTPIMATDRIIAATITVTGNGGLSEKPGAMLRAFFMRGDQASATARARAARPCGRSRASRRNTLPARA